MCTYLNNSVKESNSHIKAIIQNTLLLTFKLTVLEAIQTQQLERLNG